MAKYKVTPELAYTIRTARTQKNITAKAIAEHINKSQSYMSRLENSEIKTIDEDTLSSILLFIYKDSSNDTSLESILDSIYSTLKLQYSDKDITDQLWFYNFDTVIRKLPIPIALVENVTFRMKSIGITVPELCRRINANEGILPDIENSDRYPFNEWIARIKDHTIEFCFIKMRVSEQDISGILNGSIISTNYVTLLAIIYYLIKIEQFGSQVLLSEEENIDLSRQATDLLNQYQFFSIAEKNKLAKEAKSQDDLDHLLSSFDRENHQIVAEILSKIKLFSELDIQRHNRVLSVFVQNLNWDLGFIFTLLSMEFHNLNDLSYSRKAQMLSEINRIIQKYKDLPEQQKTIDLYNYN